jgi:hypothetical protein
MDLNQLTHAISNRAFRAAHASGTPIATVTPFSINFTRAVSLVRGGPANLLRKMSELQFDKHKVITYILL